MMASPSGGGRRLHECAPALISEISGHGTSQPVTHSRYGRAYAVPGNTLGLPAPLPHLTRTLCADLALPYYAQRRSESLLSALCGPFPAWRSACRRSCRLSLRSGSLCSAILVSPGHDRRGSLGGFPLVQLFCRTARRFGTGNFGLM
jgi:hypothetical protein